jgi:glycine C-acetyltransferase
MVNLLVDDAHGLELWVKLDQELEHLDCVDDVDIYFSTFIKSMASIGAFVAGKKLFTEVQCKDRRFSLKSLPMPFVIGLKRLIIKHSRNTNKTLDNC